MRKELRESIILSIRKACWTAGKHEIQITFADDTEIAAVILEKGITDSFKMRVDLLKKTYSVEVTDSSDAENIPFICPSLDVMVSTYLAIACFWRERIKSFMDRI